MREPLPRVAIQRNPISGSGRREHELKRMIVGLKQAGLKPYLFTNRERLARHLHDPNFRQHLLCIVAAGGDGTVDDLINRYPGFPLAIFAMGTENLLAKYCQVPRSGRAVAEMIAARHVRTIDLGLAGRRRFAVMASCGFDAEVVQQAHATRTGRITKLHYIAPIVAALRQKRRPVLSVSSDGAVESQTCELAIISNINRYALNLPVNPTASDQDGQLDVCLVKQASPLRLIGHFLRGFFRGQIDGISIERFQTRRLTIRSAEPVAIQADGDPVGQTPLEFRSLPQALELIVPADLANGRLATKPMLEFAQG